MKKEQYLFVILLTIFTACQPHKSETVQVKAAERTLDASLQNANKIIVQHQAKEIDDYVKKNNWHTTTTGTGLRYDIYTKSVKGRMPNKDNTVAVAYTLSLLDGTVCYTFTKSKAVIINIGHAEQTKGLEEALCLMKEGEKAHLIVPEHIGYGLSGDTKQVPPKSTLVYDVELLDVK
jgi:FKBP-type peptidyl-prolyl cis-trans isomerase FkpA